MLFPYTHIVNHPRTNQPLHQQAPTTRFSNRAADYGKYRPTYPAAAIDLILQGLADPPTLTAADVGAGTGISSRLLADRGVTVLAVEPNPDMAAAADPHPRVRFVQASAESTTLSSSSIDLIVCAQAFHWFRHSEALAEFARILRPAGRLALIWNILDQSDPASAAYVRAIRTAIKGEPPEMMELDPQTLEFQRFTLPTPTLVPHEQLLDRSGLIGRAMSASYVPKDGPAGDQLRVDLAQVHAEHANADSLMRLRYQTHVYRSERI